MVEHYNDTVGVTGSSPVPPTIFPTAGADNHFTRMMNQVFVLLANKKFGIGLKFLVFFTFFGTNLLKK